MARHIGLGQQNEAAQTGMPKNCSHTLKIKIPPNSKR
jgi:hypothetical protein